MEKVKFHELDDKILQRIEDAISVRLKNTLSIHEALDWLSNFPKEECELAVQILERIELYTEMELVELWHERIISLISMFDSNTHFMIHPVAAFGKSGTLMTYYFQKSKIFRTHENRFTFYESHQLIKKALKKADIKKNAVFVLIDDFCGTGHTIVDYYNYAIKQQFQGKHSIQAFTVLTLFSLPEGISHIEKETPELIHITEIKIKAFAKRGSVFGSQMPKIRDFAFRHGKGLFTTEARDGKKFKDHPLGYNNSQALIVFPYNPPNNTLPIIWSTANDFNPLFARSPVFKINEAKRIRKDLAFYISLLKHTDKRNFRTGTEATQAKEKKFTSRIDFLKFGILFLKRKRRSKPTICQILGITQLDFDSLVSKMVDSGLLDENQNFTVLGENLYQDVISQLRHQRKENRIDEAEKSKIDEIAPYFPKIFKGRSKV